MTTSDLSKYWLPTKGGFQLRRPLLVNQKDGSILMEIPAGEFQMGDGKASDCLKHRVYLDLYYIGAYAVTNQQYKKFVDETGHWPPPSSEKTVFGTSIWKGNSYPEDYRDHPVVCVSWEDAQAYCEWAGLSLPTEAQWEKAARGPGNFKYPWGNEWKDVICVRNYSNYYRRRPGIETTQPVYAYPEGVSGYGLYNTSGNVGEWCWDWYSDNYYQSSPKENPEGPSEGFIHVVRGGSWNSAISYKTCRAVARGNFLPTRPVGCPTTSRECDDESFCSDYVGFRIALQLG